MHRYPTALLAITLLSACAPGLSDDAPCLFVTDEDVATGYAEAEAAYVFEIGYDNPDCSYIDRPVDFVLVTEDDWPDWCPEPDDGTLLECVAPSTTTGQFRAWYLECQGDPVGTARHARLHTILNCDENDPDPGHKHPSWGRVAPL